MLATNQVPLHILVLCNLTLKISMKAVRARPCAQGRARKDARASSKPPSTPKCMAKKSARFRVRIFCVTFVNKTVRAFDSFCVICVRKK